MVPETLVGRELHSTYRVIRPISKGGMGAIYEAAHTRLPGKRYALKVLHPAFSENIELLARFRREAEICSALGHENIVDVLDTNVTPEGVAYLVMELLDGEDLAARIKSRGPMPLADVLRLTGEMASALDAAHRAHIVHRDLKPQNVFLARRGTRGDVVKVLDFGISKVLDSQTVMTREHALVGTPFYMSPEQADGRVTEIDARTDVFALGAIVWEMLTGQMAFAAPNHSVALYRVSFVDPPEVHTLRPDVPPAVSAVLRRAMAKVREHRTPGVLELARELEAAARGVMPANVPPPALASLASLAIAATVPPATDPAPPPLPSVVPPPLPAMGSIASMAGASGEVSVPPRPRKIRAPMYIAAGVVVAAFAGGGAFVALQGDTPAPAPAPAPVAAATVVPPPMPNLSAPAPAPAPVATPAPAPEPPAAVVEIPSPEPVMIAVAERVASTLRRRVTAVAKPALVEPASEPPPVRIEPARPTPPPPVAAQPPPVQPQPQPPPPVAYPAQQPQPVVQPPPPPPKKKKTGTIFDDD